MVYERDTVRPAPIVSAGPHRVRSLCLPVLRFARRILQPAASSNSSCAKHNPHHAPLCSKDEKRGPSSDPLGRQLDLAASYNNLNDLTSRDWSGKLPMWGSVGDPASILVVQGVTNAPPYWNSTNWLAGATLVAGSNDVDIVTILGTNSSRTDVTLFMPPTKPQQFNYDLNGNLTNDGYRVYTWTEENRLARIETSDASASSGVSRQRSDFLYDGMGRRILRTDYTAWNGSAYATTNTTRFIWDGWLLLAEYSSAFSPQPSAFHVWGLDLSQSRQGAGGIGGLLSRVEGENNYLYAFDGNGNVTDVLDGNGAVVAHCEFDSFGQTVCQTGNYAAANPWRFSTKQADDAWGLYYYGYRYYSPQLGRWISRDPLGERGGRNVYAAVGNDMVSLFDAMGLVTTSTGVTLEWPDPVDYTGGNQEVVTVTFDCNCSPASDAMISNIKATVPGRYYGTTPLPTPAPGFGATTYYQFDWVKHDPRYAACSEGGTGGSWKVDLQAYYVQVFGLPSIPLPGGSGSIPLPGWTTKTLVAEKRIILGCNCCKCTSPKPKVTTTMLDIFGLFH